MSYRRACEAKCTCGAPAMAVRAHDLALGDLIDDGVPGVRSQSCADVEALVPEVVELQDERVGLAAVDAGMVGKEVHEQTCAFSRDRSLSTIGVRDVSVTICAVVLAFVRSTAGLTVVIALAASLATPGEIRRGLALAAAAA
ncbi:MAG: hypothetical protein ACRDK4_00490 [Solirubrobacteraceae bacterium]